MCRVLATCPFELSLELARWADCIIGDYDYAFDPRVYLKRFFDEENGAYVFLVDEAHNLVDRSRDRICTSSCSAWIRFTARNHQTLIGFDVMGGIFGEGIDLVGERLSGAVIVGVGLPAICPERELIRSHFDGRGTGFDYAYRFPGIDRMLQAAGRAIRTEQDRGAVLLVDRRFCAPAYRSLFPDRWSSGVIGTQHHLKTRLKRFWSSAEQERTGHAG